MTVPDGQIIHVLVDRQIARAIAEEQRRALRIRSGISAGQIVRSLLRAALVDDAAKALAQSEIEWDDREKAILRRLDESERRRKAAESRAAQALAGPRPKTSLLQRCREQLPRLQELARGPNIRSGHQDLDILWQNSGSDWRRALKRLEEHVGPLTPPGPPPTEARR